VSLAALAKALGKGVEIAALTPYTDWVERLGCRESLSETVGEEGEESAEYELLAVQELDDLGEKEIEVCVIASDGYQQLKIYFYAKPEGLDGERSGRDNGQTGAANGQTGRPGQPSKL